MARNRLELFVPICGWKMHGATSVSLSLSPISVTTACICVVSVHIDPFSIGHFPNAVAPALFLVSEIYERIG